jgi:TfoX/Sxy family transcriptional regulator of competence genes
VKTRHVTDFTGKWRPAAPDWVRVFSAASAGLGEPRRMFGYPCTFVNGNMLAGLFQTGLFVRLSEPDRAEFLRIKGATRFEPLPGRVMREYVTAPADMVHHPRVAAGWIRRAFTYASALPPKRKRAERRSRRS